MNRLNEEVEISLVFPAYNEADRLENAVLKTMDQLKRTAESFEIIIAEDGSTDGTDKVAEELSRRYPQVKHLHSDRRLGRGRALNRAFKKSKGGILIYTDVDLSTDPKFLKPLIQAIKSGYDFATGSRMHPKSVVKRSTLRRILSLTYNLMVRIFLKSPLRDHQCGFKAFKREPLMRLLDEVKADHWFWDTEVLVLAYHSGYRVKEIPVVWRGGKRSKVRMFSDIIDMGVNILKLWLRLKTNRNLNLTLYGLRRT